MAAGRILAEARGLLEGKRLHHFKYSFSLCFFLEGLQRERPFSEDTDRFEGMKCNVLRPRQELNKKLWIAFVKAYNTNPDSMDFTIMMCIHAMRTVRQYSLDMSLKPKFVDDEATPQIKWNAAGSLAKLYKKPTKTQAKKGRLERPEAAAAGIKPSYPARKRQC